MKHVADIQTFRKDFALKAASLCHLPMVWKDKPVGNFDSDPDGWMGSVWLDAPELPDLQPFRKEFDRLIGEWEIALNMVKDGIWDEFPAVGLILCVPGQPPVRHAIELDHLSRIEVMQAVAKLQTWALEQLAKACRAAEATAAPQSLKAIPQAD